MDAQGLVLPPVRQPVLQRNLGRPPILVQPAPGAADSNGAER